MKKKTLLAGAYISGINIEFSELNIRITDRTGDSVSLRADGESKFFLVPPRSKAGLFFEENKVLLKKVMDKVDALFTKAELEAARIEGATPSWWEDTKISARESTDYISVSTRQKWLKADYSTRFDGMSCRCDDLVERLRCFDKYLEGISEVEVVSKVHESYETSYNIYGPETKDIEEWAKRNAQEADDLKEVVCPPKILFTDPVDEALNKEEGLRDRLKEIGVKAILLETRITSVSARRYEGVSTTSLDGIHNSGAVYEVDEVKTQAEVKTAQRVTLFKNDGAQEVLKDTLGDRPAHRVKAVVVG